MQAPRLVATDVDGTLLGPDELVSPRAAAVIGRLVAAGVGFVLATGRPPRWVRPVTAQLDGVGLAVCSNGAVVYDVVADVVVWSRALSPGALAGLGAAVATALPDGGIAVERVLAGRRDDETAFVADRTYLHAWLGPDCCREPWASLFAVPAVKLLIRCPELSSEAMVAELAPLVGDLADLTYSTSNGLVEASAPGVCKATGMAEVADRMGLDAADVVAFGDMPNDLEMLRWAGHGVAMGNAHPALLEVADEVTATNGEDGVALVLERWF